VRSDAESQELVEIYYWEGLAGEIFTCTHSTRERRGGVYTVALETLRRRKKERGEREREREQ
jgi:hypothetical protein